jgi:hypothetical protein
MSRPVISITNSAVENVDAERPLTDILWYAKLNDFARGAMIYGYNNDAFIMDKFWAYSGDRNKDVSVLLGNEPLSFKDNRNNVINGLVYLWGKAVDGEIGSMLYFIAETTDAKFQAVNHEIEQLKTEMAELMQYNAQLRKEIEMVSSKSTSRDYCIVIVISIAIVLMSLL